MSRRSNSEDLFVVAGLAGLAYLVLKSGFLNTGNVNSFLKALPNLQKVKPEELEEKETKGVCVCDHGVYECPDCAKEREESKDAEDKD